MAPRRESRRRREEVGRGRATLLSSPLSLSIYTHRCSHQSELDARIANECADAVRRASATPAPATSSLLRHYCASLVPSPIQFQIWTGARARPIGQLQHRNQMITNVIVNKSLDHC